MMIILVSYWAALQSRLRIFLGAYVSGQSCMTQRKKKTEAYSIDWGAKKSRVEKTSRHIQIIK